MLNTGICVHTLIVLQTLVSLLALLAPSLHLQASMMNYPAKTVARLDESAASILDCSTARYLLCCQHCCYPEGFPKF